MLTHLLHAFDFELDPRSTKWMKGQKAWLTWAGNELLVMVRERERTTKNVRNFTG